MLGRYKKVFSLLVLLGLLMWQSQLDRLTTGSPSVNDPAT